MTGVRHPPQAIDGSTIYLHIQCFNLSLKGKKVSPKTATMVTANDRPQDFRNHIILRAHILHAIRVSLLAFGIERGPSGPHNGIIGHLMSHREEISYFEDDDNNTETSFEKDCIICSEEEKDKKWYQCFG